MEEPRIAFGLALLIAAPTFVAAGEIHDAVKRGDAPAVQLLLERHPEPVNIWCADRTSSGWGEVRLQDRSLSPGKDGRPIILRDGTLFFCSWRDGVNRIYRARSVDGHFTPPERLVAAFNEDVIASWVSDDQTRMIFESSRAGGLGKNDFWISVRGEDGGWGTPANLGGAINSAGREGFASFSPDGKYFFFGSDRDGSLDIYWVSADRIGKVDP